jgi:molybdopterin molybdotransferase
MAIAYHEALSIILEQAASAGSFGSHLVTLQEANGRVCAMPIFSRETLPRYTNSAVDGFSVNAAYATAHPTLLVEHRIVAGETPRAARPDMACAIMTGAPIPLSHDAVLKIENVTLTRDEHDTITSVDVPPVREGTHLRAAGTDFQPDTPVVLAGERIRSAHILALAAVGVSSVSVVRKPRVVVIATGGELAASEDVLAPGQIHNATAPYLQAALPTLGAEVSHVYTVNDDAAIFSELLQRAVVSCPDLIVTTGAVSKGIHDFVPTVVTQLGGRILFHRITMRPGGPMLFGSLSGIPIFGLPGNPLSTVIGTRFGVAPYIRRRFGLRDEAATRARLTHATQKADGLACFFKGMTSSTPDGTVIATVLPGQASYQIHSFLHANAWVVLPVSGDRVESGTLVDIFPIDV